MTIRDPFWLEVYYPCGMCDNEFIDQELIEAFHNKCIEKLENENIEMYTILEIMADDSKELAWRLGILKKAFEPIRRRWDSK